jgi:hypothetical protein
MVGAKHVKEGVGQRHPSGKLFHRGDAVRASWKVRIVSSSPRNPVSLNPSCRDMRAARTGKERNLPDRIEDQSGEDSEL